jgi:acyl carrier protein
MKTEGLEDKIRRILREELGVDDEDIEVHTPIVTSGLVDSAGLVRLATLLETETGVSIPDRDIHSDNFDTLAKIDTYVRGKLAR